MQQSVAIARAFPTPPLVVDLDGTLVRTDLLAQSFFGPVKRQNMFPQAKRS